MTGVIMCGGQSSRMGSDKGLLENSGGGRWATQAYDLLKQVCDRVVVSVNSAQADAYQELFAKSDIIVDDENLPFGGPSRGLFSVHTRFPTDDLFLLACDLVHMSAEVLMHVKTQHDAEPSKEAFCFYNDSEAEPLAAVYTAGGLAKVLQLAQMRGLKKTSMKYILEHLDVKPLLLPAAWKPHFLNVNAKKDLENR